MEIKSKIGNRIKELREVKQMSQKDLAYTSDLDRSYIASVENGQRNISIVNIYKNRSLTDAAVLQNFNAQKARFGL